MHIRPPTAAGTDRRLLTDDELERIRQLPIADEGHGHDHFGTSHAGIAMATALLSSSVRDAPLRRMNAEPSPRAPGARSKSLQAS